MCDVAKYHTRMPSVNFGNHATYFTVFKLGGVVCLFNSQNPLQLSLALHGIIH